MQQYIASSDCSTARSTEIPQIRPGSGLTAKIVVSGALVMLSLVVMLLASSFYTVTRHYQDACLQQAGAIVHAFERNIISKDDFGNSVWLSSLIQSGLVFAPYLSSVVVFKSEDSGLLGIASSRGIAIEKADIDNFEALREDRLIAGK